MAKLSKFIPYIIIFILGLIIAYLTRCEDKPVIIQPPLIVKKTELIYRSKIKDSIRVVYKDRWHRIKANPERLPCDTFVNIVIAECDSLIALDSSYIYSLKEIIVNDSNIIAHQSDSINVLNKSIKRQKRKTKLVAAGLGVLLGVSLFR